jgi:hypothetical protein
MAGIMSQNRSEKRGDSAESANQLKTEAIGIRHCVAPKQGVSGNERSRRDNLDVKREVDS